MEDFKGIYTEEERKKQKDRELSKLLSLFDNADQELRKRAAGLCHEAAFMRVMLYELRQIIMRDGMIERYQNGATQYGLKKSSAVELYDKTVSQYIKIMAQINKLLPGVEYVDPAGREIIEFIMTGK